MIPCLPMIYSFLFPLLYPRSFHTAGIINSYTINTIGAFN